ncbi:MAG TPA: HEAT repeat domain-containing protein [Phycisphaerae bacterium]|nr:HEAT repeat domain-containing protein [Phycisphaerae bacterium]
MASSIQSMIPRLGSEDPAEAFKACREIEKIATASTAPGKDADRAELAAALAAELLVQTPATRDAKGKDVPPAPKHSATVRNQVCRLLAIVSGAKEVPALLKAIEDLQVREEARRTLDRNRSDEATDALIEAIQAVGAEFRVGVVNSLGKRQDDKVVTALTKVATSDEDPELRINAVEALANIPSPANAETILKATQCPNACHATRAWKAAVRLAENLRNAGRKNEALDLYRKIRSSGPEAQQAAARIGRETLR